MTISTILWPTCPRLVLLLSGHGHSTVRSDAVLPSKFFFSSLLRIDVPSIPDTGSWLQVIANGTTTLNTGANGLQRLDKVVELAAQHNIYILFSLTNNWSPSAISSSQNVRRWATPSLPRNYLSNDYGKYRTLIQSCAPFTDWTSFRRYGCLRSRVWRSKDT